MPENEGDIHCSFLVQFLVFFVPVSSSIISSLIIKNMFERPKMYYFHEQKGSLLIKEGYLDQKKERGRQGQKEGDSLSKMNRDLIDRSDSV